MNTLQQKKEKEERSICFSFLSPQLRLGYGIMTAVITAALVFIYSEQGKIPFFGGALAVFCFFALCSIDRWRFNCTKEIIEYSTGCVFFAHTRRYSFADIEKTGTERFIKGFRKHEYMKCFLHFKKGGQKTVAVFPVRWNTTLVQQWEMLTLVLSYRTNERRTADKTNELLSSAVP